MSGPVKIVTANRLLDGAVVYLGQSGGWVERLSEALPLASAQAADARLTAAAADVKARLIVEPYAFDANLADSALRPLRVREVIRAAGPTVRRDLGKQAEPGA